MQRICQASPQQGILGFKPRLSPLEQGRLLQGPDHDGAQRSRDHHSCTVCVTLGAERETRSREVAP